MKLNQILFALLVMTTSMASAQQLPDKSPDKEAAFFFFKGNPAFILSAEQNGVLFKQVCDFIDAHRELIKNGSVPIHVYGYCGKSGTPAERKARARQMSNYVKGKLVQVGKAVENNFITKNSVEPYSLEMPNAVVLQFILPPQEVVQEVKPESQAESPEMKSELQAESQEAKPDSLVESQEVKSEMQPESQVVAETTSESTPQTAFGIQTTPESKGTLKTMFADIFAKLLAWFDSMPPSPYELAARANMLHWITATPSVGVEWRPVSALSVLVDVDYAPWRWSNKQKYYRQWNVQPQVRYYIGTEQAFYAGAEFHVGQLNWKVSSKGKQGRFIGGGLVGGYRLPLNRSLDLDFNLGVGYTSYKYDKYKSVNGYLFSYDAGLKKNYWGITSAGVSLVWKICK